MTPFAESIKVHGLVRLGQELVQLGLGQGPDALGDKRCLAVEPQLAEEVPKRCQER